jgi:hypothetical protein
MQDATTGAFKAVAIFGYYFAVREKRADKTMTRQADTERTAQANVPPRSQFFVTFAAFVDSCLRPIVSPSVRRYI